MNRKLKATWTYEASQDLRAWANNQAAQKLTEKLAAEINKEIDEEILRDLEIIRRLKPKKKKREFRSIKDDWSPSAFS